LTEGLSQNIFLFAGPLSGFPVRVQGEEKDEISACGIFCALVFPLLGSRANIASHSRLSDKKNPDCYRRA